ncbi:uncharacterized protein LOC126994688 [Eriocheir sinensis]|uniref:uncharacterized protein LOC126994688 n=1 Tax=Eriocheir sinensis TaxID=95602 RepID=UPI0021C90DED|nr:uncharacterized protein LOC126994688 [Eriocheir sinensis]
MWWTPGGSEQPRAAATLPAGVPPPGPGPGHAASRGCCSREAKLRIALYTQARVLGVPGAGRIKDNTDEEVISFISCQEQGNDSLVTAESPFLSIEGRQHTHEVFKGRKLKENVDLCKEKPRNADGEISGTGSRWAPPRDLSAPPASIHTHVTGLSALPSRRHRRSWNWFNETGGRRLPPRLRTRLLGTPTWAWLWAAALVVWWCTAAATAGDCRFPANQTCPSMYLRNLTHLEDLCACAKVSGCLHLSLIYVKDENEERYLQSLSFPHLLEITDYLFIYDVPRLSTLGKLFPNLSVIRGERVFYNYALVIRKMRDLQEVGLFSLTAVLRGSVRVEGNPRLCFAHTVDWDAITSCRLDRNVIKKNKPQCDEPCSERCRGAKKCDRLRCWNQDRCQILCSDGCQGRCVAGPAAPHHRDLHPHRPHHMRRPSSPRSLPLLFLSFPRPLSSVSIVIFQMLFSLSGFRRP